MGDQCCLSGGRCGYMRYLIILIFLLVFGYLTVLDANKHYREEINRSEIVNTNNEEDIVSQYSDY